MGSPCIDLDMNLMSSPVPPERDCGNGGNKVDGFPAPSAAPEDRPSNGGLTPNDRATLDDVNGCDLSRPSHANSNFALGSTEGGGGLQRCRAHDRGWQDYLTLRRDDCDGGIVAGGAVHDECEEFDPDS